MKLQMLPPTRHDKRASKIGNIRLIGIEQRLTSVAATWFSSRAVIANEGRGDVSGSNAGGSHRVDVGADLAAARSHVFRPRAGFFASIAASNSATPASPNPKPF
jgi:hypothetical protein